MSDIPTEETEMREFKVPTPDTPEELAEFVRQLVEREHDYGTCVYAMSLAATAAFKFAARKLGVTGFQASCADMDIIRRTRSWEGPFILLNGDDLLYPQYDLRVKLEEWITKTLQGWGAEKAREFLENKSGVAPAVLEHWEKLAGADPIKEISS